MTPNTILKHLSESNEFLSAHDRSYFSHNLPLIKEKLEKCVTFSFMADIEDEHMIFGKDLHINNLLYLPFDPMYIKVNNIEFDALVSKYDEELEIISFAHNKPILLSRGKMQADNVVVNCGSFYELHSNIKRNQEVSNASFNLVYGCIGLLSSKETEQRVLKTKDGINEKRFKQNKPPINETRIITIRKKDFSYKVGIEGAHTPKCTHWRRGHIRTYSNGVKIPIPPCIVNLNEEYKPTPKEYKIKC